MNQTHKILVYKAIYSRCVNHKLKIRTLESKLT